MTKEILLVQQHTGSYDDYRVDSMLATFEQEKADALIKSLEERKQRRDANWNLLMLKMQEWEDQNPRPRISPIGIREDKKRAKKENRKYDPSDYLSWANRRMTYQESISDTFGEEGKRDLYEFSDNISWSIESIPFE